jgi:hypothetical protein
MKKIHIFLTAILILFVAVGAYFLLGANLKVSAAASVNADGVHCDLAMSNGSIFPFEYIEFIAISPEGARITRSAGEGEDIPALSRREMSFVLSCPDATGAQVEIGYYVLGMRRRVILTLK